MAYAEFGNDLKIPLSATDHWSPGASLATSLSRRHLRFLPWLSARHSTGLARPTLGPARYRSANNTQGPGRSDAGNMRGTHRHRTDANDMYSHSGARQIIVPSAEGDQADCQGASPRHRSHLWTERGQAGETTPLSNDRYDDSRTIHQRSPNSITSLDLLSPSPPRGLDNIDTCGIMPGLATETLP